jgi:poly(A) polymerase
MIDAASLRIEPPDFLCEAALTEVLAALPQARIVGGAVRDALAGMAVADVDLATPQQPPAVKQALQDAGIRVVTTGIAHGTVTAVIDGRRIEITTLRRDVKADGRRATVAFTDDWRVDAARRDFTINAMSMTADGTVFDYFDGVRDLSGGIVRFVGDPTQRIAEDYLRILRYFRFYARYGAVPPEPAVQTALRNAVPGLARLSAERVWSEIVRILSAPDPTAAVTLMSKLGVLQAVMPEGTDPAQLGRLHDAGAPVDPLLRVAALVTGDLTNFSNRLRLSWAERQRLQALGSAPLLGPDAGDDDLRRALADIDRRTLISRTWLEGTSDPAWARLRQRLSDMARPRFPLRGKDILALGLTPGASVGALMRATRAWWLAGGCRADAQACRAEATRLLVLRRQNLLPGAVPKP